MKAEFIGALSWYTLLDSVTMLYIFIKQALIADKFMIEAVLIETLTKEVFDDRVRVLVMFLKQAFTADRFTMKQSSLKYL